MSRLHLFNPENDLALAADMPHFTPPRAAATLARSLACLPGWWADPGDMIICTPEDAEWLSRCGLSVSRFDGTSQPSKLSPWGWSKYARRLFSQSGVQECMLPSAEALDSLRLLGHRRLSAQMATLLDEAHLPYPLPPFPVEVSDIDAIGKRLSAGEHLIIKSPWSGSGRGIIDTSTAPIAQSLRLARGVISRQGSVMVESALDKVADFAMLFDMEEGKARFRGLSLFYNESYSTYAGNILGSPEALRNLICRYIDPAALDATQIAVANALEKLAGSCHEGPIGVDMLVYRTDGQYLIAPCIEVNLRMTMGRVAHELYARHLPAGFSGLMQLKASDSLNDNLYLWLSPPGRPFAIVVKEISDADIAY